MSRLQGAALSFLLSSKEDWTQCSYQQLKEKLVYHFESGRSAAKAKLLAVQCGKDLWTFNEKFTEAAATATAHMGEEWVKDVYLDKLPVQVATHLALNQHKPLQKLQSKATDVQARFKTRAPDVPRFQDPERARCDRCGSWHRKRDPCANGGTHSHGPKGANPPRPFVRENRDARV